jgi:hypothetical protein
MLGALAACFLVHLEVVDKFAVLVGMVAFSRYVLMGKAWHIMVFIVGHGRSWRDSGSCRAPLLAATTTVSSAALSTLTFFREACCHNIWGVLLLRRAIYFVIVVIPLSTILDVGCLQ